MEITLVSGIGFVVGVYVFLGLRWLWLNRSESGQTLYLDERTVRRLSDQSRGSDRMWREARD